MTHNKKKNSQLKPTRIDTCGEADRDIEMVIIIQCDMFTMLSKCTKIILKI